MASSRRSATNENVSTYGSGKSYTVLATWEEATDNNLVTATQSEVLECYKGSYNDYVNMSGATTNSSYFRIVRPATGEDHGGIPKKDASNVYFYSTTAAALFYLGEEYSQVQDIVGSLNYDSASTFCLFWSRANNSVFVGCCAVDSSSTSGRIYGLACYQTTFYAINCLVANLEGGGSNAGMGIRVDSTDGQGYIYNCLTAYCVSGNEDAGVGFADYSTLTPVLKNCISFKNYADTYGTWSQTTNWLDGSEGTDPDFVDSTTFDYRLEWHDNQCIDEGTDLSGDGTYAFDDDIAGATRS